MKKKKLANCPHWTTKEEIIFINKLSPHTLLFYRRACCMRSDWGILDRDRVMCAISDKLKIYHLT